MAGARATRPEDSAHARAVRSEFPVVVAELRDLLGAKICAVLGSVRETRAVAQWAAGTRTPGAGVQRRLRVALHAAVVIAEADSPAVAQAWFQGMNPQLDDRPPLLLLADGDLDEIGPAVIGAARAFVGTG